MKPKQIKWLVWACAGAALLAVVMITLVAVVVPAYVERKLIPGMAHKYGLDARQVQIRRIGWFGADMGPVQLDGADTPVVHIAAVHIDYSPISLLRGNIKRIALGGVRLVLAATPEGVSIPGLNLPPSPSADKKPASLPDLENLIPIGIEAISIDQSEVVLLWKGKPIALSLDMDLALGALHKGRLNGRADLSFLGSTMTLTAALDQQANTATLTLENSKLLLGALAGFFDLPSDVVLSSSAALKGQSSFSLTPLGLKELSLSGHLAETHIAMQDATLQNLHTPQGTVQPIRIAVEATKPSAVQWRCAPFLIKGPVRTHIMDFKGEWAPGQPGWSLNGIMRMVLPAQPLAKEMALPADLPMTWELKARQMGKGALAFEAHTTDRHPLALEMAPFGLTLPTYQMEIKGGYADGIFRADTDLAAKKVRLGAPDGEITMAGMTASGALSLHPTDTPAPSEFKATAVIKNIRVKQGATQMHLPRFDLSANGKRLSGKPWRYRSHLKLAQAAIADTTHGIRLRGIQVDMPLHWPPQPKSSAGTMKVRRIQWRNHQLGDIKGRLEQKNNALDIALRHNSKLFPKLNVFINGRIGADGTALTAKLPAYQFPDTVDLGRFASQAAGVLANGQIEANAKLSFDNSGLNGSAFLKVAEGSLYDPQRELMIDGINMDMVLDDILALKSAPQQKLRVDRLSFGKIMADDLEMDFRLEGPQSLFIEQSRIQWCLGRVSSTALRIAPGQERYDVTLFCDRLNLAMVLEQLGAGKASGAGTVNGSIPIRWHKGRLSFDNGFLYSTPGNHGAIQLTGTEVLLSGLPPETPQHTQVDIATEALKDYTYKWAKLSVESQKDDLLLKLQFDGKPNRLLPFAFDQQLGRFKRVAGEGQADFKGISIDLNFKSPLDKILHYKKLLTPNQ